MSHLPAMYVGSANASTGIATCYLRIYPSTQLPIASPPLHHIYRSTSHRAANVTLAVRWVRGVARLATLPRNHLAVEMRGGFVG